MHSLIRFAHQPSTPVEPIIGSPLRTTRTSEIDCLNDLGEAVVLDASWLDEGLNILRSGYPSISWSRQQDGGLTGDGTALGFGRLDFILTHNHGCTHLYVQGSHHVEQKALIKKMAAHLGGLAFDAQTGQVLP